MNRPIQNVDTSLRGKPISEFFAALCKVKPQLSEIHFATYRPEPKLSERLQHALTNEEKDLRDAATQACHGNGIPFWDALFGICMTRDHFPERFIDVAFSHRSEPPARTFRLKRTEVSRKRIMYMIRKLPNEYGLVVGSRVLTRPRNRIAHIPMLDFRCPPSPANARAVLRMLGCLGQEHGVLAESGRSYHFYGVKLLSPLEWYQFMARALLFAPITDPRYIAHRLIDSECRLKVVSSGNRVIPRITDVF